MWNGRARERERGEERGQVRASDSGFFSSRSVENSSSLPRFSSSSLLLFLTLDDLASSEREHKGVAAVFRFDFFVESE